MERKLVASKKPTSDDLTWYNLYSDGWIEQGGRYSQSETTSATKTITFPIEMENTSYYYTLTGVGKIGNSGAYIGYNADSKSTTSIRLKVYNIGSGEARWDINGYAAESEYIDKIIRREFIAY